MKIKIENTFSIPTALVSVLMLDQDVILMHNLLSMRSKYILC